MIKLFRHISEYILFSRSYWYLCLISFIFHTILFNNRNQLIFTIPLFNIILYRIVKIKGAMQLCLPNISLTFPVKLLTMPTLSVDDYNGIKFKMISILYRNDAIIFFIIIEISLFHYFEGIIAYWYFYKLFHFEYLVYYLSIIYIYTPRLKGLIRFTGLLHLIWYFDFMEESITKYFASYCVICR